MKQSIAVLLFTVLSFLHVGYAAPVDACRAHSKHSTSTIKNKGCGCPAVYNPVCGVNGVTYSNRCRAICSKVKVKHKGSCKAHVKKPVRKPKRCVCNSWLSPVCGVDGKTYSNRCRARCYNIKIKHTGKCAPRAKKPIRKPRPCVCPVVWSPVCGVDGKTYSNSCHISCAGIPTKHRGACKKKLRRLRPVRRCPKGYAPKYTPIRCVKAPCPQYRCIKIKAKKK